MKTVTSNHSVAKASEIIDKHPSKEPLNAHSQHILCDAKEAQPTSLKQGKHRGWLRTSVVALCIVVVCFVFAKRSTDCYALVHEFLSTETTEDAYVTGHVHQVGAKIAGTIDSVLIKDNQLVERGQIVATIDPRDIQVEVAKAQAHVLKVHRDAVAAKHKVSYAAKNESAVCQNATGSIKQAEDAITKSEAGVQSAEADVSLAKQRLIEREAELLKTKLDLDRYVLLEREGAVPRQSLETVRKDYDVALAAREAAKEEIGQAESKLNQARADLKISKAQLINANAMALQAQAANAQTDVNMEEQASSEAQIKEAEADLQNAKLRLSYTKIAAPVSGRIGKRTVEEGQRVLPGTPLLSIVGSEKWIVANFKETQLKDMRVGQKVKLKIDAFGQHEFAGKVESFSPASGASFALLPPDNATGNFTKIVQRVPVKIVLEEESVGEFKNFISPGMSCEVRVWVR